MENARKHIGRKSWLSYLVFCEIVFARKMLLCGNKALFFMLFLNADGAFFCPIPSLTRYIFPYSYFLAKNLWNSTDLLFVGLASHLHGFYCHVALYFLLFFFASHQLN